MQAFDQGKQREHGPARGVAHSTVDRQRELNPVANTEPIDDAASPAQQEAPPRPGLARHRDQQRSERYRRQPGKIEAGEGQHQKAGRTERQQPVQHGPRCACSLTASAI